MEQGPQDPDAGRAYQAAQEAYPPPYTGQAHAGQQPPPAAGPYAPPPGAPYGYPYGYPYPPARRTNTMAILALVFAFVFAPAAIVMGVVARRQIQRTGEDGMGMATAGMIIGIVFTVLSVIWIIVVITLIANAVHNVNQNNGFSSGALPLARAYLGI